MLRGELDWITMKALEKYRARRYETANELAADLLRFLADEPVTAARPSRLYRAGKFIRRNKGATIAAAAALGGLAALIVGTTLALVSQSRQRQTAERERAEAQFNLAAALHAQSKFAEAEALYRQALSAPLGDALQDRQRAARALLGLGQVASGAGATDRYFREAIVAFRAAFPSGDSNIAHALTNYALYLRGERRYAEAEPLLREAYDVHRLARPSDHYAIATSATYLGNVLFMRGKHNEAEQLFVRAIAEHEMVTPPSEWGIAMVRLELVKPLVAQGRYADAEAQLLKIADQPAVLNDFYVRIALVSFYTQWDRVDPNHGHDDQARQRMLKFVDDYYRPEADAAQTEK